MSKHSWNTDKVIEILELSKDEHIDYVIPYDVIDWIIKRLKRCDYLELYKSYKDDEEYEIAQRERSEWGIYG